MSKKRAECNPELIAQRENIERARKTNPRWKNQEQLAEAAGIHIRSYGAYERGQQRPDTENLIKLADTLGVSTDFILGRTRERSVDENAVAEYIGLSPDSVRVLHYLAHAEPQRTGTPSNSEEPQRANKMTLDCFDRFLAPHVNETYNDEDGDVHMILGLFYEMETYIRAGESVTIVDGEPRKVISIEGNAASPPHMLKIDELYKEAVFTRIKMELEALRQGEQDKLHTKE